MKIFSMLIFLFTTDLFCSQFSSQEKNKDNYEFMDAIALEAGTDKSSAFHDYTQIYSQYFHELKDKPLTFLEIGIYKGNSVKLWEKYFPVADLHFIDITPRKIEYNSTRSHYHFLDQTDALVLTDLGNSIGPFDIIIDDGGHTMVQQITSFKALFPFIKSGGIYVIEDLHTSYWSAYGGVGSEKNPIGGPGTTMGFLQDLVDSVNFVGASTRCANFNLAPPSLLVMMNDYQKYIYSMHFYGGVCIIIKR